MSGSAAGARPPALQVRAGLATDVGRVRALNEDRAAWWPELGLAALADGMGGHQAGDVAAELALAQLEVAARQAVASAAVQPLDVGAPAASGGLSPWARLWLRRGIGADAAAHLGRGVRRANRAVHGAGDRRDVFGMGTTLVALWFTRGGLHWANVGDSRLYRWYEGQLTQVSRDHSLLADYLAAGLLTPAQVPDFPYRHVIVRGIGLRAQVQVDLGRLVPRPGERYLLCSDGLTDLLGDEMIAPHLGAGDDPSACAQRLVEEALAAGGTDNITALVLHVSEAP